MFEDKIRFLRKMNKRQVNFIKVALKCVTPPNFDKFVFSLRNKF